MNLATAVVTILWHRAQQLEELPDVDTDPDAIGVFGETAKVADEADLS